jgi:ABC-2 type transport system permease protein
MSTASSPAAPTAQTSRTQRAGREGGPAFALVRRTFRDARIRTITFAYLFAIYAYIQPAGYRHTYSTLAERLRFARSFADNRALRLFYGEPHNVASVDGYTAWRVGGTLAIVAAVFGLLAAVRALRAEEESGRTELVLAGIASRRTAYLAALGGIGAGTALLWIGEVAGFLVGGLPAGGSAYLALATISVAIVFVGVGAVTSQLAPTRRVALELGGGAVALLFLLRVIADTANGAGWLRWLTPLGWAEELRPLSGARPFVLVLPIVTAAALLVLAGRIGARRDIGTGMIAARDESEPRLRLLGSPAAHALRSERTSLLTWTISVGLFAFILGVVSKSVTSASIPKSIERELQRLGSGSIASPTGYLAFVFIFFVLAVSLFACAQIGAARHEESEERLQTLLSLPVGRVQWLGGRLALAAAGVIGLGLVSGFGAWAGAEAAGVGVSLPKLLEAGANCIPVALLFLGIAALAYAIAPRASAGIAYGLVTVAFLWQLVGSLVAVPKWLVDLTPFGHIGFVPTQSFRVGAALVMVGVGVAATAAALALFRRRDLAGA